MGFNSTLLILNDALHDIRDDKDFGKKVHDAITQIVTYGEMVDIHSGSHVNAASVIETHHADSLKVIAVGGNTAKILGYGGNYRFTEEQILMTLAERLGYSLKKKPTKEIEDILHFKNQKKK